MFTRRFCYRTCTWCLFYKLEMYKIVSLVSHIYKGMKEMMDSILLHILTFYPLTTTKTCFYTYKPSVEWAIIGVSIPNLEVLFSDESSTQAKNVQIKFFLQWKPSNRFMLRGTWAWFITGDRIVILFILDAYSCSLTL